MYSMYQNILIEDYSMLLKKVLLKINQLFKPLIEFVHAELTEVFKTFQFFYSF